MSRDLSEEILYNCGNDHSQTQSCTGHRLKLEFDRSSDTVTLWQDGEIELVMGDEMYSALKKAMKA